MFCCATLLFAKDWRSGIDWKEPAVVTPGEKCGNPPSDATILFDGKDLSAWENQKWKIENGEMVIPPKGGTNRTKEKFGSFQLHIEFATPAEVNPNATGQQRGNSGVYLGKYELQILDSYENTTYFDGQCGSIYKQRPPQVNVCRKPGEWQSYDILFTRPDLKIEDGKVKEVVRPAYITVLQNGVMILNHHEIEGTGFYDQPPRYEPHPPMMPIELQDHGNPVRFRNIWIRPIPDDNTKPPRVREPYYHQ